MADVVVIGAGIVGCAVARAFAREGAEVRVIDRGAAASATSARCEGNLLVSDKAPGPELQLAQRSLSLWTDLAAELTEQLGPQFPSLEYQPKGGVVVALTEFGAAALTIFATAQRAAGVVAEECADPSSLEPDLSDEARLAVFYPQDAQLQPVAATEALLASARRAGATLTPNTEVLGPLICGGRLTGVRTSAGDFSAATVVVAAGPWSGEVSARLGAAVPVLPRRGVVLVTSRMRQRVWHKVYDADYVGAVESDDAALQTSSVVESTAAGTVLIGSSRQRRGFDDSLDVAVLQQLAAKAMRLFPFLADIPVIRSYGGFRAYLPDHLPLIGPDPRLPGLWHATGHEGAGVGLAPATAELLVDLAAGRPALVDPQPFSVLRPTLGSHLRVAA